MNAPEDKVRAASAPDEKRGAQAPNDKESRMTTCLHTKSVEIKVAAVASLMLLGYNESMSAPGAAAG